MGHTGITENTRYDIIIKCRKSCIYRQYQICKISEIMATLQENFQLSELINLIRGRHFRVVTSSRKWPVSQKRRVLSTRNWCHSVAN